ncbi:protein-glutamine glutaminase family protein [Kitasatospora sp. NPDC093102]|uniref:protein-glutamine glutaminase family protein n=1 Tax=Kitasatospora sp. NPDC093102 TaxID=3155069 RepID=UPI00343CBE43
MSVSPGSWLSGLFRFGSSGKALPSWWAALMGGMSGSSYPLVDAEALVAGAGALRRAAGRLDERAVAFQRFAFGLSAVMPGAGSMMASTLVSVGQPSRDGADGLRECADGLREQAAQVDYAQKSAEVTALVTLWMVAQLVWVVATTGGVSAALIPEVLAGGRRSVEEIVAELLSAMRSGAVFGSVQDLAIQLSQQREYRDGLDVTSLLIAGVGGMAGGLGDVAGRGLVSGVAGPELLRRLAGGALGGVIGADAGVVVSTAWQGGPWDASVFAEATGSGAGTGMLGGALHHAVERRRTALQQALHDTAVTERPAQSPTGEPGVAERTAPKRPAAITSGGTGETPASDPATGPAPSYARSDWRSRERNWVQAVAKAQDHPLVREVQALAPERLRAWQDALPAAHRQQLDLLVKPLMAPADSPAPAALFPEPAELVELRATFAGELALHRLTDPGTTADHVLDGERRRPTDRAVIADGHARHAFLGAADRQTVAADRRAGRLPGGAPSHGSEPVRAPVPSGMDWESSGPFSLPATASSGESSVALPHPPAVPALPMPVIDRLAHQLHRELTGEGVNAPALLSLLHQATTDSRPLQPVAEHYEQSHHQSLAEELFQARAKGRLTDEAYALALDTMAPAPATDLSRLDLAAFVADLDSAITSGDERRLNRLLRSLRRTIPLVFDVEDAYAARSAGGLSLRDNLRRVFPEHGEYFGFLLGHDNNLETKVIGPAEALHWHATAERTTFVDDAGAELPVPFDYPDDGCHTRAHVVAKMLSRSGIYSRKVFAVWDDPARRLMVESENAAGAMPGVPGTVRWQYHVAPLVLVDEGAGQHVETVIDPSLSNKPQPLSKWLATIGVHSYARIEGFETDPQEFLRDLRDRKRQPVSSGELGAWGYPKDTPVVFTTGRVNLNHVFNSKPLLTREEPSSLRFPEMTWGPDKGTLSTYSSESRYRGELRTVRAMLQRPQTTALELTRHLKTSPFTTRLRQDPLVARPLRDLLGESACDDLIAPRILPAPLPDLPRGPVPPLHPPTGTAHPAPLTFPAGAAAVAPPLAALWKPVLDDLPVHDNLRTVVVPYLSGDGIPHSSAGPLTLDDFKDLAKAAGWRPGSDLRVVFAALHPDAVDGYDHQAYTAYLRRVAQSLDHDHPTDGGRGVDIYTVGTLAPDLSLAPAVHPNAPKGQEDFTAMGTHRYWGHWVRIATRPDHPPRFTSGGGQLHPVTPHHPNTARQEAVDSHTHPFAHAPGHPEPADGIVISTLPVAKADPPTLVPQPGLFTVIPHSVAASGHPTTTDHAGKPFVITPGLLARALRNRGYSGQDLLWQVAYPPEHRAAAVRYLLDLSTELGNPDIYLPAPGSTGFTVDDGHVKNRAHDAVANYERLTMTPDVPARFTTVDGTLRRHHPTTTPPIDPLETGTPHAPEPRHGAPADPVDSAPPSPPLSPAHQALVEEARNLTAGEIETWWEGQKPGYKDFLQDELRERTAGRVTLPEDPKDLRRCTYLLELALEADLEDDFATLYPHLFSDAGRPGGTSSHPVGAADATTNHDSRPGRTTPPVRPDEPRTPLQEISPPPARSGTHPVDADPSSTAHGLPAGPTEPAQPAAVTSPPRLPTDAWPAGLREKARDFLRRTTASVLTEDQLTLAERTLDLVTANDRSATAHTFASQAAIRVYRQKTADILRKIAPSLDLRTYDPTKPLPLPGSEARLLSIHSVTTPNGRLLPKPVVEAVTRTVVAYQRGPLRNEPAISATTPPARKDLDTPPGSARPAVTRRPVVKAGTRLDDTTPGARGAGTTKTVHKTPTATPPTTGVAPRAIALPTVALPPAEGPHPPGATNRTRAPGSGRTGPVPTLARPERPRTAPAGVPPTPPNTTAPGSATRGTRLTTRPNTTRAKQPPVERQPGSRQTPEPHERVQRAGLPSKGSTAARSSVHLTEAAATLHPRLDPRDPLTRLRRHVFGTTPATDTELLGLAHTLIEVNYPITPDTLRALRSLTPLLTPGTTTPSPEALTTVVLGIPDPRPEDVCDLLDIAKALLDFNGLFGVHRPLTVDTLKRAAEGHAPDQSIRAT